jgi:alpha-galactosidase
MRDALRAAGRPIVFSICEWGDNRPWEWAPEIGHLWRTTGDIVNCWNCELGHGSWTSFGILNILDKQAGLRKHAGPGAWNDPDMMEVGNLPTLAENRSHFAMWAMLAAPLIAGTDVIGMSPDIAAILTNPRLVAIDQDPLGLQGFAGCRTPELEVWVRPLSGEKWAIAVLNRSDTRAQPDHRLCARAAVGRPQPEVRQDRRAPLPDFRRMDRGCTGNDAGATRGGGRGTGHRRVSADAD